MRHAERYTSPSRLDVEKRVVFHRLPLIVGHASELRTPGRFFTHDAAGIPLLLTRDFDGNAHAMLNVCRHRGTRLVEHEEGVAETFVCKYHAWKYDLSGQLERPGRVALPQVVQDFVDECALVEFPCETRHGFLWTVPTARARLDVASWLGDVDGELTARCLADYAPFRRTTLTRAANWKLVTEALLALPDVTLLLPSSLLFFDEGVAWHLTVFARELEETWVTVTMLAPPALFDEPARLEERWASTLAVVRDAPIPEDDTAPRIRAFHDALDLAIAASAGQTA
jgi:phenylpropionate dioxygenase-like ring-hydroxylating dioxygenase large terminal subunit